MSMLEGSSLIILGGDLADRKNCLANLINSPHLLASAKELINTTNNSRIGTKETVPESPSNDPDTSFLTPDGQKIGVDQIRQFLSQLRIKPINRSEKIGIILEAEKLTIEAQNALLKTLEEPPDNCVIFLSAPNKKDLLPTIISRCLIIDLGNPSVKVGEGSRVNISGLSVGEKFALAQKVGASRSLAVDWLDQLLIDMHQKLLSGEKIEESQFQKVSLAKKMIQANTNLRLTLENLFLDW